MIRLDALLARNLACSRTAAARLLKDGRVQDDGGTVLEADDRRRPIDEATLPLAVHVDGEARALVAVAHILTNRPAA
jgi:16S rRNA U516 pseudouridylate synthase RsuA-like enzyme